MTSFVETRITPQAQLDHVLSVTQGNVTFYLGDKNAPAIKTNGSTSEKLTLNGGFKVNGRHNNVDVITHHADVTPVSSHPDVTILTPTVTSQPNGIQSPLTPGVLTLQRKSNHNGPLQQQASLNNPSNFIGLPVATPSGIQQQTTVDINSPQENSYRWNGKKSPQDNPETPQFSQPDESLINSSSSTAAIDKNKQEEERYKHPLSVRYPAESVIGSSNYSGMSADISLNDASPLSPEKSHQPLSPRYRGAQDSSSSDDLSHLRTAVMERQRFANIAVESSCHEPLSSVGVVGALNKNNISLHQQQLSAMTPVNHQLETTQWGKVQLPSYADVAKWDTLSLEIDGSTQTPPTPPPSCSVHAHSGANRTTSLRISPSLCVPSSSAGIGKPEFYDHGNVGSRLAAQVVGSKPPPAPILSTSLFQQQQQQHGAGVIAIRTTETFLTDIDEEEGTTLKSDNIYIPEGTGYVSSTLNRRIRSSPYHYQSNGAGALRDSGQQFPESFGNLSQNTNIITTTTAASGSSAASRHVPLDAGHHVMGNKRQRYNVMQQRSTDEDVTSSKASVYDNVKQKSAKPQLQQFSF